MGNKIVRFFRGAVSGFFFVAYGLFALPFALLLMVPIWSKKLVRVIVRAFYVIFRVLFVLTGMFNIECSLDDRRMLRSIHGKIVVMNHLSLVDILFLLSLMGDSVCIAKASVKRNPFLSAVAKSIFIFNDNNPESTVAEVRSYLGKGINVVVFPQGTRGGQRIHRGAARLALAAKADISAFHIEYDPVVLAKGQPWWDMGDRIVRTRLSFRGTFAAEGENNHHNAVLLTEKISEAIS